MTWWQAALMCVGAWHFGGLLVRGAFAIYQMARGRRLAEAIQTADESHVQQLLKTCKGWRKLFDEAEQDHRREVAELKRLIGEWERLAHAERARGRAKVLS